MPCFKPLTGYKAKWVNPSTGKRPIVFNRNEGFSDLPLKVPCGRCIGCRLEYSRQWAIRCVHEASLYEDNAFITLTYREEEIPEDRSIKKDEVQKFIKRLRKNTGKKLRYFACGEYGEMNNRAHYHAIIFGYGFDDKTLWTKTKTGHLLYRSDLLEKCWTKGHSYIGSVTFESAAYVARYITKKWKGDGADEHYKLLDPETGQIHQLEPEFCLMSRKPGIGKEWLDKYKTDTNKDFIMFNGMKMKLPKYYDAQLEMEDAAAMKIRKSERIKEAKKHAEDNTRERLDTKEIVKKAQISNLSRSLENDS